MDHGQGQRRLFLFPGRDPLINLALEELLYETWSGGETLSLYVNRPCVVMGRHQNPWVETRPEDLRREGIPLLRRISGGGTVWHDEGNLNFSFIGARASYDRTRVDAWVRGALAEFGIMFDISDKGDYLYRGSKFSGNAFAFRSDRVLHHGTLLVSADLDRLRAYLGGLEVVRSLGVRSRPASVVNLQSICPKLSVDALVGAMARAAGSEPTEPPEFPDLEGRCRERSSWEWVYGQTPRFTVRTKEGRPVEVIGGRFEERTFDEETL